MNFSVPSIRTSIIYLAKNFGGVVADILLSTGLVYLAGFPLFVAGLCGVIFHAVINYLIDLKITFKGKLVPPDSLADFWTGLTRYLKSFFASILFRMVLLALLGWFTNFPAILSLLVALGLSSALHALLTRFYVFRIFWTKP